MSKFWHGKRVAVTGHTGFKGTWLTLWLEKLGAVVMGYSLPTSPGIFSPGIFFECTDLTKRIRSVEGDVRDLDHLRRTLNEFSPEVVFHLSAQSLVRASYRNPVETYSTNVMGTVHLLEVCRELPDLKVVVNVTSDKCYQNREWEWSYRENEPMGGQDPYSSSKACSELITAAYRQSFFAEGRTNLMRVGLASARAGNVIGGGDWSQERLVPDCMRALYQGQSIPVRNPQALRPWQHVLDPLNGYILLAEKLWEVPLFYSQGWNLGPEAQASIPVSSIVEKIASLWNKNACWHSDEALSERSQYSAQRLGSMHEARHLKLDSTLARTYLDWKPLLSLESCLEWTVDWYRLFKEDQSSCEAFSSSQIERFQSLKRPLL